jgi:hypothetical protein
VSERVVPILEGVKWHPNAPDAVLVQNDSGRACLALRAHPDDADQGCVVFVWTQCTRVVMGVPNDEANHQHRLYGSGFKDLLWAGQALDSNWIAEDATMRSRPPLAHFIVPTKERTVEVVADDMATLRIAGIPRDAALEALGSAADDFWVAVLLVCLLLAKERAQSRPVFIRGFIKLGLAHHRESGEARRLFWMCMHDHSEAAAAGASVRDTVDWLTGHEDESTRATGERCRQILDRYFPDS